MRWLKKAMCLIPPPLVACLIVINKIVVRIDLNNKSNSMT